MSVRDRIIHLMKEVDLRQADLVKRTGASKGTVNQWVSGKINPSKKYDRQLAKALKTTTDYIHYGEEGIRIDSNPQLEATADMLGRFYTWDSKTALGDDEVEVPFFVDVELATRKGSNLKRENREKLRFSKVTLESCGVKPESAVCVSVSGDSMEPRLFNDDIVGVNTDCKRIVDGRTYAINHDGLLRIKRLYLLPGGGLRVNSLNFSNYPDEILTAQERELLSVIGQVFWSSSIWK
jgi:phage repressor protein C with HTH and peptisase S24 domain